MKRLRSQQQPVQALLPELLGLIIAHCGCLPVSFFRVSKQWSALCEDWGGGFKRRWLADCRGEGPSIHSLERWTNIEPAQIVRRMRLARDPVSMLAVLYQQLWPKHTPSCAFYLCAERLGVMRLRSAQRQMADVRMGQVFLLWDNAVHHRTLYALPQYKQLVESSKALRCDTESRYVHYINSRISVRVFVSWHCFALSSKQVRVDKKRKLGPDDLSLEWGSGEAVLVYHPQGIVALATELNHMTRERHILVRHTADMLRKQVNKGPVY